MAEYLTATNLLIGLGCYLFACGLAGIYVSGQKARDGMEGFLFGVLFGPAGLVVAACLPDRAGDRPAANATTKECRYCYSRIDYRAGRCPRCQADLSRPAPVSAADARMVRKLLGEVSERDEG